MSQIVKEVFDRALARAPTEWSDFLTEACEDEPTRAVVRGLLEQVEDHLPSAATGSDPPAARLGRRYGPYRVLRQIGQGGMSDVYLAVKVDGTFVRRVALKVLQGAPLGGPAAPIFEREQRIMAGLEHTGIARLYDVGTVEDEAYLAMEYVEGDFLDVFCTKQKLGLRQRLVLFLKVCAAVAYAHRNLVVHRDLKPANILVTDDGDPRLLDFGIAKLLEQGDTAVTVGPWALTPAYASPEQLRGERVNTVSDVFSLGALLSLLITGQEPFPRSLDARLETLRSGDSPQAPSSVLSAPSTVAGPVAAREVDGDLDAIVLKALREEPGERYLSVPDLADDIERFLDGRTVTARRPSAIDRLRKFVKRHKAAVAGSLVTGIAMTVAIVAMALMTIRVSAERTEAELQRDRAESVTGFFAEIFELANPEITDGEELTVRQVLDRAAVSLPAELENEPEVRAALLSVMGRVYGHLAVHERSHELLSEAYEQQAALLGPEDPQTLETQVLLAISLNERGDFPGAIELYEHAIGALGRRLSENHPALAKPLNRVALAYYRLERIDEARAAIDRSLEIAETSHSLPASELAGLYHLRGNLLLGSGRYAEAAQSYGIALAELEAPLGPDDARLTGLMKDRAAALIQLDRLAAAEQLLERALRIERTVYPDGHPKTAFTLTGLARLAEELQDFERSEPLATEAVEIRTRLLGAEHPATAVALTRLAASRAGQGRHDESAGLYRQALEIWSAAMGADHPRNAFTHLGLAELARKDGDLASAAEHLDRAARVQTHLDPGDPDRVQVGLERARWLAAQGRSREALALVDQLRGRTRSDRLRHHLSELAGELAER